MPQSISLQVASTVHDWENDTQHLTESRFTATTTYASGSTMDNIQHDIHTKQDSTYQQTQVKKWSMEKVSAIFYNSTDSSISYTAAIFWHTVETVGIWSQNLGAFPLFPLLPLSPLQLPTLLFLSPTRLPCPNLPVPNLDKNGNILPMSDIQKCGQHSPQIVDNYTV